MSTEPQRSRLKEAISKTQLKVRRYEEMTQPIAPDNAIGRVSRMDAINNKSVMEAALRKAQQRLEGLQRHLDQLGSQEFGKCQKCGENIPFARILLAPESSFCVNCARI